MDQAQEPKKKPSVIDGFMRMTLAYVCGGIMVTLYYGPKFDVIQNKMLHSDSMLVDNHKQEIIRNAILFQRLAHIDSAASHVDSVISHKHP